MYAALYLKRPQRHFMDKGGLRTGVPVRHTKRPDVDNIVKYVLDTLQPRVLVDDSYVVLCSIQSTMRC